MNNITALILMLEIGAILTAFCLGAWWMRRRLRRDLLRSAAFANRRADAIRELRDAARLDIEPDEDRANKLCVLLADALGYEGGLCRAANKFGASLEEDLEAKKLERTSNFDPISDVEPLMELFIDDLPTTRGP